MQILIRPFSVVSMYESVMFSQPFWYCYVSGFFIQLDQPSNGVLGLTRYIFI